MSYTVVVWGAFLGLVFATSAVAQDTSFPDHNKINNPDQIDRPDELAQASTAPHEKSAADLSKELISPNTPLATLSLKRTYTTFDGDLPGASDQSSLVTLFQPTFPFPLGDSGTTNLFVRPAFAYVERQPVFDPQTGSFDDKSGWADIGFDVAVGRSFDSGLQLVGGVQGTIPTDTDVSGGQWRLGPEFVAFKFFENKTFLGAFPSHQWDVGGDDYDFSTSGLELFGGVLLDDGWTAFTDSKWSYDWENDQATLPINLTVSKIVKIGNVPLKLQLAGDYFAESNDDFGQDWAISLTIAPVVPNFIYNAFNR
ncbi:MAG: hypothetical protein HC923_04350 [Myxococcales bacterium]|nr:hypothetical protein [Myxococcales bacterium]